jgi:hypothetical protein
MRTVRFVLLGTAIVAAGAGLGFVVSLLRPRTYADFSGIHQR